MKKKIRILITLTILFSIVSVSYAKISATYTGFTTLGGNAKTIFDSYIEEYGVNSLNLFGSMADCFAITNTTQPVFGEGYRNLAIGVTGGIGVTVPPSTGAGSEGLGNAGLGVTAAPFITISLDPLYSILGIGIFEDSDITFKLLPLNIKIDEWKLNFFNMGIILRKRIISPSTLVPVVLSFEGVSVSLGVFYSNNKINGNVDIGKTEKFEYNQPPLTGYVEGTIQSLNMEFKSKSFSFDSEIKGYVNLLYILDIFAGFGITYNLSNNVEVTATLPANANVVVTAPIGSSTTDSGTIIINGEDSGRSFIPRLVSGIQLNLGPVKIPVQGALILGGENKTYAVTFGVTISF
ncbi:MAG TPA: hypothetical protein PKW55_03225 [Spirochaetota bacterium]|nr:hypothetical protein [Spirochaetota bacterium]HOM39237.1 hypothetical protein [Spirochaetota bacterium]HPQ48644.1 hypothetical protein [Spirochaetota bacterium]